MASAGSAGNARNANSGMKQVEALDNLLNGTAADLGGVHLNPDVIADTLNTLTKEDLGLNAELIAEGDERKRNPGAYEEDTKEINHLYKKYYRFLINNLIYSTLDTISPKDMKFRYKLFLLNNDEFPEEFKREQFKNFFINTEMRPALRIKDGKAIPPAAYAYRELFDQKTHRTGVSPEIISEYNNTYEIPYYISLLNAIFTPLTEAGRQSVLNAEQANYNARAPERDARHAEMLRRFAERNEEEAIEKAIKVASDGQKKRGWLRSLFGKGETQVVPYGGGRRRSRTMRRHKSKLSKTRRNRRRGSRTNRRN
jgi:hypothetical protein